MESTYTILEYTSESHDTYHFLFKKKVFWQPEDFLKENLPWELEDGELYGSYQLIDVKLEDEEKEENEGSQEADASSARSGVQI